MLLVWEYVTKLLIVYPGLEGNFETCLKMQQMYYNLEKCRLEATFWQRRTRASVQIKSQYG